MSFKILNNGSSFPRTKLIAKLANRRFLSIITFLTNHVLIGFLTLLICLTTMAYSEEECLKSKVWCYECVSINEPYCSDPFNKSFDLSLMKMCEGCCVKIVWDKDSPQKNIVRTCTSKLQINLFMVDHVCMEESGGQGHMCFCESDGCNGTKLIRTKTTIINHLPMLILIILLADKICSSFLLPITTRTTTIITIIMILMTIPFEFLSPKLSSISSLLLLIPIFTVIIIIIVVVLFCSCDTIFPLILLFFLCHTIISL